MDYKWRITASRYLQLLLLLKIIAISQTAHVELAKAQIRDMLHDEHPNRHSVSGARGDVRQFQHVFERSRRWSHPKKMQQYFSAWSDWSHCDMQCKQKRSRYCTVRRKCGSTKHVEERSCPAEHCTFHQQPVMHPIHQFLDYHQPMLPIYPHHINIQQDPLLTDNFVDDNRDYFIVKKRPRKQKKRKRPIYLELEDDVDDYDNFADDEYESDESDGYSSTSRPSHMVKKRKKQMHLKGHADDEEVITRPARPRKRRPRKTTTTTTTTTTSTTTKPPPYMWNEDQEDDYNEYEDDVYESDYEESTTITPTTTRKPHVFRASPTRTTKSPNGLTQYNLQSFPLSQDHLGNTNLNYGPVRNANPYQNNMAKLPSGYVDPNANQYQDDWRPVLPSGNHQDRFDQSDMHRRRGRSMRVANGTQLIRNGREKAVFDMPSRYRRVYTKWSQWSKCSSKCTTRRFKRCRIKQICGTEVVKEVAFCYTAGSFCESWIETQMNKYNSGNESPQVHEVRKTTTPPPPSPPFVSESRRTPAMVSPNAISENYVHQGRSYNRSPEYMPQKLQCGIPSIRDKPRKRPSDLLRIIGGKSSRKGQWPWQVVILNKFKEPFCGGTLIAPQWILTAAHCVRKRLFVRLGEHNLEVSEGTELQFRVETAIRHPKYNKTTVDNDVALLKLPKEIVPSNYIGFACLPGSFQVLPKQSQCTIIGWGKKKSSDDSGTNVLHEAQVPIISNDECKAVYIDYRITKNMFCAGHKRGRIDTCAGDSGGPLLCRDTTKHNQPWTLFGITSFGDGCGKQNKFGIYAKLPNYVDWIWSVVNCNGNCNSPMTL